MQTHLYQQIAADYEGRILKGLLVRGEKLPSVRTLSRERAVSPTTIYQAYYQLEAKGLIEARARSGYYVAYQASKRRSLGPVVRRPAPDPRSLNIREMMQRMDGMLDRGKWLRLSAAIPDTQYLPAARLQKCMLDALRENKSRSLGYAPALGFEELRRLIVAQMMPWWRNPDAESLLITQGATEALSLALRAICQAGDVIVMDELSYFGIHQLVESLGLKVIPIPQVGTDGLDVEYFEQVLGLFPIKAALFVPTFHNPTGACLSEERKKRLVDVCTRFRVPLIEDDVYGALHFGPRRPLPCKAYDEAGWVIYCSSFSKTLAPGYRIGYCNGGRFHAEIAWAKRVSSHSNSSVSQLCLARFLAVGRYQYHLQKLRTALHANMLQYLAVLEAEMPEGVRFTAPDGGMVLWLEMEAGSDSLELFGQ
ncbi:MAG: PLP-dependent aminotransferase family protein, partial [Bacteroidota bacterium]